MAQPSNIVILSVAKDLLSAYAGPHASGLPILRLYRRQPFAHPLHRVTNGLLKRVRQHRDGTYDGFTKKYKVNRLVYYERFGYIDNAIAREKELKGWLRGKKVALISSANPTWEDLYEMEFGAASADKQVLRYAQDDNVRT